YIAKKDSLQNKITVYNDEAIKNMGANWPALSSFISSMYYTSLSQVLEMIYETTRAYNFWALDTKDMADVLGGNPLKITYAELINAQNNITLDYKNAVAAFGTACSYFPAHQREPGIFYPFNAMQLDFLKDNSEAMVGIPNVTRATVISKNPFAGRCNIRITKVRCWLTGAKSTSSTYKNIIINITQQGTEKITSRDDDVYNFQHDTRKISFIYDLETGVIETDGDFGVHYPGEGTNYALYGPFATWQIEIDPACQDYIDLSDVTDAKLEFFGTCYSFN
ncbi:MAG TPA: hypothetical protein VHD33_00545, partial [Legionellaceae bacterium]|nr:hypothetical protein [Legionellaceae bacterium]